MEFAQIRKGSSLCSINWPLSSSSPLWVRCSLQTVWCKHPLAGPGCSCKGGRTHSSFLFFWRVNAVEIENKQWMSLYTVYVGGCVWPLLPSLPLLQLALGLHAVQLQLQSVILRLNSLFFHQLGLQSGHVLLHLPTSRHSRKTSRFNIGTQIKRGNLCMCVLFFKDPNMNRTYRHPFHGLVFKVKICAVWV